MSAPPRPLLLASIHDVSPRFEGAIDRLLELMRAQVGSRLALLVVPSHWGDAPIVPGSPFASRLRDWADGGMEIFLHGLTHRDDCHHRLVKRVRARAMTAGEGEFLGLSRTEATQRIRRGRALLEGITGQPIAGFVAPAWLYGKGAAQALADCEIPMAEDHMSVWSPGCAGALARGPVITWASRSMLRRQSSLLSASGLRRLPMRVLRVGVHPGDCGHSALIDSIERTLASALRTRSAGRYADLLPPRRRERQ